MKRLVMLFAIVLMPILCSAQDTVFQQRLLGWKVNKALDRTSFDWTKTGMATVALPYPQFVRGDSAMEFKGYGITGKIITSQMILFEMSRKLKSVPVPDSSVIEVSVVSYIPNIKYFRIGINLFGENAATYTSNPQSLSRKWNRISYWQNRGFEHPKILDSISISITLQLEDSITTSTTAGIELLLNNLMFVYVHNDGHVENVMIDRFEGDMIATPVEPERVPTTPKEFVLDQNYPNPFNPTTNIRFSIPERSHVSLKIYDLLGKEIADLVSEEKSSGTYDVRFNGSNLPSGVYVYALRAKDVSITRKMVLIK